MLTKHQAVMQFRWDAVAGGERIAVFGNDGVEDVALAWATYEDMGRPEAITVTVEPGDGLNPDA